MSETDITKCMECKCPFFDEYGAICNMYSNHDTNYSVDMFQDRCEHLQLHRYRQAIEEIEEIAEQNIDDKQIMAVQTMLNGSPDVKIEVLNTVDTKLHKLKVV